MILKHSETSYSYAKKSTKNTGRHSADRKQYTRKLMFKYTECPKSSGTGVTRFFPGLDLSLAKRMKDKVIF